MCTSGQVLWHGATLSCGVLVLSREWGNEVPYILHTPYIGDTPFPLVVVEQVTFSLFRVIESPYIPKG